MALQTLVMALIEMAILQARRPGGPSGGDAAGGIMSLLCSCICPLLFMLIFTVPVIAGMWKAFDKAGEPGWASIIPIYNALIIIKIAGLESTRIILWLIPFAGYVFAIIDHMEFAKAYGKEGSFGLGLVFLGPIFWPMLGFGSAKYIGAPGKGRRMDVDDDYDRPAPRRRARRDDDEGYQD